MLYSQQNRLGSNIALSLFHLWQYSKLKCWTLHLLLDCQSEHITYLARFPGMQVGAMLTHFTSSIAAVPCRTSSPPQSQPVPAAGCALAAASNDCCLPPVLFLYTEAQQPCWTIKANLFWKAALINQILDWNQMSNFSLIHLLLFASWSRGNHHSHTSSWRKNLFHFLTELPKAVTQPQHTGNAFCYQWRDNLKSKDIWNRVEPLRSCMNSRCFLNQSFSTRSRVQLHCWAKGSRLCKPGCHPS